MTGMRVQLASSSARILPCRGSRCCTRTNAIPVSVGRFLSSSEKASSPPADAPTPTINPQDGGAAGAPSPVRSSPVCGLALAVGGGFERLFGSAMLPSPRYFLRGVLTNVGPVSYWCLIVVPASRRVVCLPELSNVVRSARRASSMIFSTFHFSTLYSCTSVSAPDQPRERGKFEALYSRYSRAAPI